MFIIIFNIWAVVERLLRLSVSAENSYSGLSSGYYWAACEVLVGSTLRIVNPSFPLDSSKLRYCQRESVQLSGSGGEDNEVLIADTVACTTGS